MPGRAEQPGLSRLVQLGIAFNVSTLVFALPVYDNLNVFVSPPPLRLLMLMGLVQGLPALTTYLVGRILARSARCSPWLGWFWGGLIVLGLSSVARYVQSQNDLLFGSIPAGLKLGASLAVALTLVVIVARHHRVQRQFGLLAPVFLAVSAYFFVVTTTLHEGVAPQAAPSPALQTAARHDSVYILIFDELGRDVLLKDGQIDGERFPNLKLLASEGIWATNATANYYFSCHAMPSLMSGRFVPASTLGLDLFERCFSDLLSLRDYPVLATLSRWYAIAVYGTFLRDCETAARQVCGAQRYVPAFAPAFSIAGHWLPAMMRSSLPLLQPSEPAAQAWQRAVYRDLLADLRGTVAPGRVHFLHLVLPHSPYVYGSDGIPHASPFTKFNGDPGNDGMVYLNYQQQAMLVDALLGRLLRRLKAEGLYEEATIVVTSDQGPRLPYNRHPTSTLDGIAAETPNIPLLIRSPRLAPQVTTVDYQHVDFVPTLLDVLGIAATESMDGLSLLASERPERTKRFMAPDYVWTWDTGTNRWTLNPAGSAPSGAP